MDDGWWIGDRETEHPPSPAAPGWCLLRMGSCGGARRPVLVPRTEEPGEHSAPVEAMEGDKERGKMEVPVGPNCSLSLSLLLCEKGVMETGLPLRWSGRLHTDDSVSLSHRHGQAQGLNPGRQLGATRP